MRLVALTTSLQNQGKQKNVRTDVVEGKVGRLHMHKQDTSKLVTRSRFRKALKRARCALLWRSGAQTHGFNSQRRKGRRTRG